MIYDANLTLRNTPIPLACPTGLVVGEKFKLRKLDIVKDDNDANAVLPLISRVEHEVIGTPYNWLTYNIQWDANGFADSNVVVIDFLPFEVNEPNYISNGGQYIHGQHIVRWELGNISENSSGTFKIQCGVNYYAKPCGVITNRVHIEGDNYYDTDIIETDVNYYGGEILYVDKNVVGGYRNGTSWSNALLELSEALDIANENCASVVAIWTAKGIYKPVYDAYMQNFENKSFILAPNVGLFGHFAGWEENLDDRDFSSPANETILDGQIGGSSEKVYYVVTAENIDTPDYAVVDGFTIKNAWQYGIYVDDSNIGITNCKITNNPTGIYATQWSHPDIHNCVFKNHTSQALNVNGSSDSAISYSVFDGNNIDYTTGFYCSMSTAELQNSIFKNYTQHGVDTTQSTLSITDCNFTGNNCGFRLQSSSTGILYNNTVSNSTGTGISCSGSNLTMERSVISDNANAGLDMSGYGNLAFKNNTLCGNGYEGLLLSQTLTSTITNNLICDNGANSQTRGAGIKFSEPVGSPLIRNNTICGNRTYGIQMSYYGGEPAISNCIIYGNDTNDFYRDGKDFYNVTYSCLQNPRTGTGNFVADPCFISTSDFHLTKNSRCVNAGNPNISYANEFDIDNEVRTQYGRADVGCDEFYGGFGDYNTDDIVNFLDYRFIADNWQSNEPNYSMDDDNDVDIYDLTYFANEWLWQNESQTQMLMMSVSPQLYVGGSSTSQIYSGGSSISTDSLMLSSSESLSKQPARLRQQSERFYSLSPRNTVSVHQQELQSLKRERFSFGTQACRVGLSPRGNVVESEPVDVNDLLNWLDDVWENDEAIRDSMSESEYLEFRNAIENIE
jgi:parallel beta-helix repeat protein